MEGYTAKRIAEELCNKYKVDKKDIDIIIKDKENYYFKNNKFKLFSGIKEIIDFVLPISSKEIIDFLSLFFILALSFGVRFLLPIGL